jgi:radical SAM superfamily enzyme YgiQ (UPF0313 family)
MRDDSTTLGLDAARSVSFDAAGRLLRASWDGRSIRRSLDHRFVERRRTGRHPWRHVRRELSAAEAGALLETIRRDLRAVRDAARRVPAAEAGRATLGERLDAVLAWTAERLAAEAGRFAAVYRPVPVLPPDQHRALVVQLTEGCPYGRCVFCPFYRDRPFRVKTGAEFSAHLQAVRAFFGEGLSLRRGVFVGDADALALPAARLLDAFERLAAGLTPRLLEHGIAGFIDAFGGSRKSLPEVRALARLGLRRVYLGLESGCDEVLAFLEKPAAAAEALALVDALHGAGVQVGVIVLLGAGGAALGARHVTETQAVLRAMRLRTGDILYLSPLVADEDSPYRRKEREAGIRAATDEEFEAQLQALRAAVQAGAGGPKVAVYDIRDFLY